MFETLFSKTFFILTIQFVITWAATTYTIEWFRKMYEQRKLKIKATENENGELDLHLNFAIIKPYFWGLLIADIIVFIILLIFQNKLFIGFPLFCIWSILTGIEVALALLSVDENIGKKILAITACITALTAMIGMYSGIDFAFMGSFLFFALIILIILNILRLFISIPRITQKVIAFFGCLVFTGYLIFDFFNLAEKNQNEIFNTWPTAMSFAIDIYLDVINLFLELLDLLSN